jgi:CspA family cold shock protein
MEGKIKWYKREKGFGFVVGSDNKDYFVHYTALPQDQEDVRESDEIAVTFEVKETDRGTQAVDIKFTSGAEATSDDESEDVKEEAEN